MSLSGVAKAAAMCVVLEASGAYGQVIDIYDCTEQYTGVSGVTSQEGNGAHQRLYQPMPVQAEAYTVIHVAVVFSAGTTSQNYSIQDLVGPPSRTATLEFLFGEYNEVDGFVEDTSLPRPPAVPVTFSVENLTNAPEDPEFVRQVDIDVTVSVPTGKQLQVGLIGDFDWTPNNELLIVPESLLAVPPSYESGWWVQPDGGTHGLAVNNPGLTTGHMAMRVEAQMGIAVPTTSFWGGLAMTLLILAAGSLVYARRGPVRKIA